MKANRMRFHFNGQTRTRPGYARILLLLHLNTKRAEYVLSLFLHIHGVWVGPET